MQPFPAQYSTLSAAALIDRIIEAFGIAATHTQLLIRNVSDTYRVAAGGTQYILKIYRSAHRSLEQIKGEVALINALKEKGAKVAYPIADRSGSYIQTFHAAEGIRYGILFSYAQGKVASQLSEAQLQRVGQEMAYNHSITASLELEYDRPEYSLETTLHQPLEILQSAFTDFNYPEGYAYLQAIAGRVIGKMNAFKTDAFSQGYSHYDYLPKNFHFTEEGDFTLFDFDFAGKGYLVNDLMTFQVHYFFQLIAGAMEKEKADQEFDIFLQAYRKQRSLSEEELAAIPYLGIMFWVFYLSEQYKGFNDFSNPYFNQAFLKRWLGWIEKWEELYCSF